MSSLLTKKNLYTDRQPNRIIVCILEVQIVKSAGTSENMGIIKITGPSFQVQIDHDCTKLHMVYALQR